MSFEILFSQDTIIPLWPGTPPNRIETDEKETRTKSGILRISKVQQPDIAVYLPSKANSIGKGMLIFPGGGYGILAYDWEGTDIAKWLNSKGIAAFVVKYRLPDSRSLIDPHEVPLIDAQRALRIVRGTHERWHLDPDSIGIIGFSAGGHLASTLGTHFDQKTYEPSDSLDSLSARPDFMVLMYPVITFTSAAVHKGSREALLGNDPDPEMLNHYSTELQISRETPPTLLVHATDDTGVAVENSLLFYKGLKEKGVPATLHVYAKGGHGFSLATGDAYLHTWTDRVISWLQQLR
jgi:acetyl esterase/lipase